MRTAISIELVGCHSLRIREERRRGGEKPPSSDRTNKALPAPVFRQARRSLCYDERDAREHRIEGSIEHGPDDLKGVSARAVAEEAKRLEQRKLDGDVTYDGDHSADPRPGDDRPRRGLDGGVGSLGFRLIAGVADGVRVTAGVRSGILYV